MPGYADSNPMFQQAMRLVTDVTNAINATVTTSFAHDYSVGLIVRISVPREFGMVQLHKKIGTITEVPTTDTFVIDIDTTSYDVFTDPDPEPWYLNDYAAVTPVGEINSSLAQATRNVF